MALKNEKTYCGNGFPNLPDFKDLSGGGSGGSAAVMAGQAIRISDIRVSNVSYKRINASVDNLTIAVDGVTNKLKSMVKGLKDFSTTEVDTGIKWIDGKEIYAKVSNLSADLNITTNTWTNLVDFSAADVDTPLIGLGGRSGMTSYPLNLNVGDTYVQAQCARASAVTVRYIIVLYTKKEG